MKRATDYISQIYVQEDCVDLPYTNEILTKAGLPMTILPVDQVVDLKCDAGVNPMTQGKKHLVLCRNRGKFFKPCPGTREYRCCEYQVLNIGMNCPMDCVYCILQAYLNNPWLSFFVNVDDMLTELRQAFVQEPDRFWRIGTGEFTDSLVLDRWTGLSRRLVEFFGQQTKAVLELKTKTAEVENLQGLQHNGRTVVAWSLNSRKIMERSELRAASLEERLQAAALCASWGYRLAFHFDPIVYHDGWQAGYAETVKRLFEAVPAKSIAWISMGCLRYIPALKSIATARFPGSRFFYEEFVPGLDGKSRYFRPLRVQLYRQLGELLAGRITSRTCLYLCMESDEVWQEVFGYGPEEKGGLAAMLDLACQ